MKQGVEITETIGISIQIDPLQGITLEEAHRLLRDEIRKHVIAEGAIPNESGMIPVEVTLSCGHMASWIDTECVPFESVPCSCGDPTHWFVKYKRRIRETATAKSI